ncbi:hypothetical protein GW17_00036858, partial [Ensete ventricosum]
MPRSQKMQKKEMIGACIGTCSAMSGEGSYHHLPAVFSELPPWAARWVPCSPRCFPSGCRWTNCSPKVLIFLKLVLGMGEEIARGLQITDCAGEEQRSLQIFLLLLLLLLPPSVDTTRKRPSTVEIDDYRLTAVGDGRNRPLPVCNFVRYGRYIPVRRVAGTQTAQFHQKSIASGRLREKSTADGRLREKSIVGDRLSEKKGRRRRRGKEEKRKEEKKKEYLAPARHPLSHVVAARGSRALFLPRREKDQGD